MGRERLPLGNNEGVVYLEARGYALDRKGRMGLPHQKESWSGAQVDKRSFFEAYIAVTSLESISLLSTFLNVEDLLQATRRSKVVCA